MARTAPATKKASAKTTAKTATRTKTAKTAKTAETAKTATRTKTAKTATRTKTAKTAETAKTAAEAKTRVKVGVPPATPRSSAPSKRAPSTPTTSKPAPQPAFAGFPRDAMGFWHELSLEMSREWFAEHKARYEQQWVAPLTSLIAGVTAKLAPAYAPLKLGEPRVLRIYRDVRFARDKTPYKTHIAAVVRVAGKAAAQVGNAALYVHLGLDEEYVGNGCYQFDSAKLVRWRRAVVGKAGDALIPLIAKLREAGYNVHAFETYTRVPKGLDADHPRADLLKMKGLTCGFPEIPAGLIHRPEFATWLLQHAEATAPLVAWLHRHVG